MYAIRSYYAPSGGSFSGPGMSGNVFNPMALSAGNYTVSYTGTDGIGCETTANFVIRVLKTPGNLSYLVCEGGNSPVMEPVRNNFV